MLDMLGVSCYKVIIINELGQQIRNRNTDLTD